MQSWSTGFKVVAGLAVAVVVVLIWISFRPNPDAGAPESAQSQQPGSWGVASDRPEPPGSAGAAGEQAGSRANFQGPRSQPGLLAPSQPGARNLEMPPPGDAPFESPELGDDELEEDLEDVESLKRMALSDPDPDERMEAVLLLGTIDDRAVIPVLAQALHDPDPEVRLTAVETLGDFEGAEPVAALREALGDSDPDIRFEALGLLADIGGPGVREAVTSALSDEDEDVRDLAQEILELEYLEEPEP